MRRGSSGSRHVSPWTPGHGDRRVAHSGGGGGDGGPAPVYRVADAEALPFENGSFDVVVAYNSLIDVQDLGAAVVVHVQEGDGHPCLAAIVVANRGTFSQTQSHR